MQASIRGKYDRHMTNVQHISQPQPDAARDANASRPAKERKRTTSQENAKKKFLHDETVTVALGRWPGTEAITALTSPQGAVIANYIH